MRRQLTAISLALALLLGLCGCASMLNTDYLDTKPHAELLAAEDDPDVSKVESYSQLVTGIDALVEEGLSHGVLHLSNYKSKYGDVETDLDHAGKEVTLEDPLGAYAVQFIRFETAYIVSYYEVNIYISYRRTQDQVSGIIPVTGTSAIRDEIQSAMSRFASEVVLQVSYFSEDESFFRDLIRQTYYDQPLSALGMPSLQVAIYPDTGYQRIVELLFTYPEDQAALQKKSVVLARTANEKERQLSLLRGQAAAAEIFRILREEVHYASPGEYIDPERLNTAYAALVEGRADSEGMALAFQLLAKLSGLNSTVISGTENGALHFWNVVEVSSGEFRHIDATREDGFARSDADLAASGYLWSLDETPKCGAQPGEEPEEGQDAMADGGTELTAEPPSGAESGGEPASKPDDETVQTNGNEKE